ncbi:MAG: MBL fold metallo-hydrolase [Ardenticatenaceae bacterium]|nr:MBL fold metallo-hydrolase [Ardenticatenaceae bacterium]
MKIKFYAHASFRLEGDRLTVITDPYTPGPRSAGFDPIHETADIVIMSSATDRFHSDPSHILGNPTVVNALEIPPKGVTVKGLTIRGLPSMESLTHDFGRDPRDNAMYTFTLEAIRVLHLGDIGNPIPVQQLEALNERLNTASHEGNVSGEPHSYWQEYGYNNKEVRGKRVSFFITEMDRGRHTFPYFARATHAGEFVAMPAEVYAMYDLTVWGRSASSVFTVAR